MTTFSLARVNFIPPVATRDPEGWDVLANADAELPEFAGMPTLRSFAGEYYAKDSDGACYRWIPM